MNEKFNSFQIKTNRYFSNQNNHCYSMSVACIPVHRKKKHESYLLSVYRLNYARKERERLLLGIPWETLKIIFVKLLYGTLCIPPPIVFQPFLVCANYFTRATDIAVDLTSGLKTVNCVSLRGSTPIVYETFQCARTILHVQLKIGRSHIGADIFQPSGVCDLSGNSKRPFLNWG